MITWATPSTPSMCPSRKRRTGTPTRTFAQKVIERLGDSSRDITILTICRSGKRSMLAAQLLEAQGYKHTANIAEGFEGDLDENHHRGNVNGWRFHGLPWEQT